MHGPVNVRYVQLVLIARADVAGRVWFSARQVGPINLCSMFALSIKFMIAFDPDYLLYVFAACRFWRDDAINT